MPLASRGTKVDVSISCRDLVSTTGIAPDTFAVVYSRTTGKTRWMEVTRTEDHNRDANPSYRMRINLEYRFELYQELRVVILERSTPSGKLDQQGLIGVADCTLGRIVSARGAILEIPLVNVSRPGPCGMVLLAAEEVLSAKKSITMEFSMTDLMSDEQALEQKVYLESLKKRAHAPLPAQRLARRGLERASNVWQSTVRKKQVEPTVMPAHMENVKQQEVEKREEIKEEIVSIETAPPPFVPFLSIMRAPPEASAAPDFRSPTIPWEPIYKSMDIKNYVDLETGITLDKFTLSEYDLTEGVENRLLKIAVVKTSTTSAGQIVGDQITTFPALKRACMTQEETILHLEPKGLLRIHHYSEEVHPSFIEYIKGGWCDFGLVCAIDFTSSNGNPRQPGTRHYNNMQMGANAPPNEYEAAMRTVGNMLASYSADSRIPAYGFGANLPPTYSVSHCFPVTENELGDRFCNGVDGLIRAYKATLNRIQLYGPTIFSQVLRTVGVIVSRRTHEASRSGNNSLPYTVLLILTDGVISDYDATLAELIKLSKLPLSVVIIGVGSEDFGKMHSLDSSNGLLKRGNEFAAREFVQFVPYQDFKGDLSVLAERVLGGIPEQVLSYITKIRGDPAPGAA